MAYASGVIDRYPRYVETCQQTIDKPVTNWTAGDRPKRVALRPARSGGIIGAGVIDGTVWNLQGHPK